MFGRTFFVILFFWAALTVITPILVRLSASAKLLDNNGEMTNGGIHSKEIGLLSRRALGSIGPPEKERHALSSTPSPSSSPSPSPSSQPHTQTTFEPEVSGDTEKFIHTKKQNTVTLNHMKLPWSNHWDLVHVLD